MMYFVLQIENKLNNLFLKFDCFIEIRSGRKWIIEFRFLVFFRDFSFNTFSASEIHFEMPVYPNG